MRNKLSKAELLKVIENYNGVDKIREIINKMDEYTNCTIIGKHTLFTHFIFKINHKDKQIKVNLEIKNDCPITNFRLKDVTATQMKTQHEGDIVDVDINEIYDVVLNHNFEKCVVNLRYYGVAEINNFDDYVNFYPSPIYPIMVSLHAME